MDLIEKGVANKIIVTDKDNKTVIYAAQGKMKYFADSETNTVLHLF